ncbi:MAG: hypothetical protein ISS35_00800 [Kiritimatiellae bacterium]|nr:hypothetical protein [Kiritimatiellia bacterium]
MQDGSEKAVDQKTSVTEDMILDLNFVPQWARREPGSHIQEERGRKPGRRDQDANRDARRKRPQGGPRDRRGRGVRDDRRSPSRGRDDRRPQRDARERVRRDEPRLPVEVKLFPEQHGLSTIVKKVATSRRAYPLVDIAYLFLGNSEVCSVKFEGRNGTAPLNLFQCQLCRGVASDQESMLVHLVSRHLDEFFTVEETEVDAPTGNFVCVARCGLSGELLAPPNHHSYDDRVREMHRNRFSHMSESAYRSRIETLRDDALVEDWREASRKRTVYTLKEPNAELEGPVSYAEAEQFLRQHLSKKLYRKTHRAVAPLHICRELDDLKLRRCVDEALRREQQFPLSLLFSLRSAFKHMHLHVFKAGQGKGMNFVTAHKPTPLDPAHVVEDIREVLRHLCDHPGCKHHDVLEALRPGKTRESPECRALLSHLSWLIERGHVIEFFDGTLAVPLGGATRVKTQS